MSWFEKLVPSRIRTDAANKRTVPEGLWGKCDACDAIHKILFAFKSIVVHRPVG